MPPRSAKRKAVAKRAKAAPKKPNLRSPDADDVEAPTSVQLEIHEHELPVPVELDVPEHEDCAADEAGPPQPVNHELDSPISCAINEGPIVSELVDDTIVLEEMSAADYLMEDLVVVNDVEIQGFEGNASVHEINYDTILLQNDESLHEVNENTYMEEEENVDEVKENKCVEGDENAGEAVSDACTQPTFVPEINSAVTETAAGQTNCDSNNILVVNEECTGEEEGDEDGAKNEDCEDDNEGNEDDEDPSLFIETSFTDIKGNKNLEIYIGRLDKGTVEDDLIEVFGKFGELKSARIVRHPTTKKSKGFAFIQFATADHAKNALSELKDGVEVKGKHVKISASQENTTIYVGNICKTWSKDNVLAAMKLYGVEHFDEIHLSEDLDNDGKNKGFALLEFSTHSDAMVAFNRLRKPDAIFGCDKSAKVAFTQTPMHPSEDVLSQVKRVYLEGLTKAWNEEKVKEICSQYGEIVKIDLFLGPSSKRKHFGFITFTTREGALACVEGINKAHTGEGGLKASIAKPQYKGRLQKQGFRGGFKVEKQNQVSSLKEDEKPEDGAKAVETDSSKAKSTVKTKQAKRKSTLLSEQKEKNVSTSRKVEQVILKKTGSGIEDQHVGTTSKSEGTKRKRKKHSRGEDRRNGGSERPHSERPSKKLRGNEQGKQRNNSRNPNKDPRIRKGQNYRGDSTKRRNPYATGYAVPPANYQGHGHATSASASRKHYTDMEPHAGFLEPVMKQERPHSGYNELGSRAQLLPHAGYLGPAAGRQGQLQTRYLEHTVWAQSHAGYIQNSLRPQVETPAVYLQPALVQRGHDPYSPALRRHGEPEGHGSNGYGYGGVGSAIPVSYVPSHASFAGYQDGGSYYGYTGAYPPRRTYH